MADSRKFMVNYKKAREAADKFDEAAKKIEQYSKEMMSQLLHPDIMGDSATILLRTKMVELCHHLLENEVKRMKAQKAVALECVKLYEDSEKKLCGIALEDFKNSSKNKSGAAPGLTPGKQNNKIKVKAKPGGKINPNVPKVNVEDSKDDNKKPTRSCWVEDFWYVDKQGKLWHYKKAYLNSDGVPTAYVGKTGVNGKSLADKTKVSDYVKLNSKDPLKYHKPEYKSLYKDGKWLTKEERDAFVSEYSRKVGTLAEATLFEADGEATLFGAEVEGQTAKGCLKGGCYAKFMTADFSANVSVGAYLVKEKDGKVYKAYGMQARAGGSASVGRAGAKGSVALFDERIANIHADVDVKALTVSAEVGACCQYIPGKGLEIAVKGDIGAYLVDVKASAGVSVLGIGVDVMAALQIGVGAKLNVGLKNGKFQLEIGAALGIGFSAGLSIDLGGVIRVIESAIEKFTGSTKTKYRGRYKDREEEELKKLIY
ncbi:hypothetical protein [Butyrivibrio sp. JL13D10]|uniref:hypothetical protein n=1 Tax=Butyrivibrio sp. JL13D10 TaxID=3236815 RepID=UPI0038B42D18